MDLGEHYPCLNVQKLRRSIEFYEKLDFKLVEDHRSENWAVLQDNSTGRYAKSRRGPAAGPRDGC